MIDERVPPRVDPGVPVGVRRELPFGGRTPQCAGGGGPLGRKERVEAGGRAGGPAVHRPVGEFRHRLQSRERPQEAGGEFAGGSPGAVEHHDEPPFAHPGQPRQEPLPLAPEPPFVRAGPRVMPPDRRRSVEVHDRRLVRVHRPGDGVLPEVGEGLRAAPGRPGVAEVPVAPVRFGDRPGVRPRLPRRPQAEDEDDEGEEERRRRAEPPGGRRAGAGGDRRSPLPEGEEPVQGGRQRYEQRQVEGDEVARRDPLRRFAARDGDDQRGGVGQRKTAEHRDRPPAGSPLRRSR